MRWLGQRSLSFPGLNLLILKDTPRKSKVGTYSRHTELKSLLNVQTPCEQYYHPTKCLDSNSEKQVIFPIRTGQGVGGGRDEGGADASSVALGKCSPQRHGVGEGMILFIVISKLHQVLAISTITQPCTPSTHFPSMSTALL